MKNCKVVYHIINEACIHECSIDELNPHPLYTGFIIPKDAIMDGID